MLRSGTFRKVTSYFQIEDNHVVRYISKEDFLKTVVAERRQVPRIMYKEMPVTQGNLVIGALSADPSKFTKDYCGLFTDSGVMPKKIMIRCPVTSNALIQPGTPLNAAHFEPGQFIDVTSKT